MSRCFCVLTVLFVFAGPGIADEPAPAPDAPAMSAARVASLVEQLGASDFERRDEATRLLIEAGPDWLDPLRAHADRATDPEIKVRLARVIEAIRVRQVPGGAVVNGLKLSLSIDRSTIRPGQTVTLKSSITNTTGEPINVQVGYSPTGNYFETGSAFRRVTEQPDPNDPSKTVVKLERPQWLLFVCGTGATPINTAIRPGQTLTFSCPMQFALQEPGAAERNGRVQRAGQKPGMPHALKMGQQTWCQFPTTGNETIKLMLQHRVQRNQTHAMGMAPDNAEPLEGNWWTGKLESNAVELRVAPVEAPAEAE